YLLPLPEVARRPVPQEYPRDWCLRCRQGRCPVARREEVVSRGRQQRQWVQDLRYQQIVRHHQRQAAESIGRAILRLTIERDGRRQTAMFAEPETAMGRTDS